MNCYNAWHLGLLHQANNGAETLHMLHECSLCRCVCSVLVCLFGCIQSNICKLHSTFGISSARIILYITAVNVVGVFIRSVLSSLLHTVHHRIDAVD